MFTKSMMKKQSTYISNQNKINYMKIKSPRQSQPLIHYNDIFQQYANSTNLKTQNKKIGSNGYQINNKNTKKNKTIQNIMTQKNNHHFAQNNTVFQNGKQIFKGYNQLNNDITTKQHINNSIHLIQNILKNGLRSEESVRELKQGSKYSELFIQKKQDKKPQFLKKLMKTTSYKGFILNNQQKDNQKIIPINTKIDDFTYVKQLGRGKFGVVSLAIHSKTGFLFAIKAMRKESILKEQVIDQIIRQVKIQSFLNHPNIVKLYKIFDDSEHIYIVMEYCIGGHLYKYIQKKAPIVQQQAKLYIRQIAKGVEQLHRQNIIHRDLKPQNIVMSFETIKLCDFGWSVAHNNSLRTTFCGTPLYVSPQLLTGSLYDDKVDLWAIGIISYQLLTGQIPFKIKNERQLVKILDSKIVYPSYMSGEAQSFIQKLLERNPIQRSDIKGVLSHPFLKQQSNSQ